MTKRPSKGQNVPSVVARLMGVEMLPFDSKMSNAFKDEEAREIPIDDYEWSDSSMELDRPKPREHPQEEELQKFKKEFEAWQAERFMECSKLVEQQHQKENITLYYAKSTRTVPREIVILRPGFDDSDAKGESLASSPGFSDDRGSSMDDFLEEVKERLRNEILGKTSKRSTVSRGGGIETPYSEKSLEAGISHGSLVRSLSAPVSRTSFGMLLLEDRHILTEKVSLNVKKRRKEKFSLKEKVSSFKYSFILGAKLFSKKLQSMEESHRTEHIPNPPTTMDFYHRHENSTEVPPSPASVCNSVQEEFLRPGDCSRISTPASTPDIHPLHESDMPRVFREIRSNISELRRQLNQLETGISGETMIDERPLEEETTEIKDNAKAYIRDLLIASGLYDGGSCDKYLSRWDQFGKPISNHVFEGVEETYRLRERGEKLNHKILCDLLNESLSSLLRAPSTEAVGLVPRPLQGMKLLDCVWEMTRAHIYPAADLLCCSLDSIVAHNLRSTPWAGLMDEDVDGIGKDFESQITGDLIQEIIEDMLQPLH